MQSMGKGFAAGFIATVVLSIVMLIREAVDFVPQMDLILMLTRINSYYFGSPMMPLTGWLAHFFIGTIVWGGLFGTFNYFVPGKSELGKGVALSALAWLFMMIFFMPMAGVGFFGLALGIMIPVLALLYHLIFGIALGFSYAKLIHVPATHELDNWVKA